MLDLHPVSELPHPIIAKAVDSFGADPVDDNFVGPIASATQVRLLEIKQSQWRGGIWQDPDSGVCWLVVAGLAKGGHQDRDDFFKRVERENQTGDLGRWLPSTQDIRILKQETASRLRTEWELDTQRAVLDALRDVHAGGSHHLDIHHPVSGQGHIARIDISVTPIRESAYEADEILLEIVPEARYAGTHLLWQLITRLLVSIEPPEQGWDRHRDTFSNIGEPGAWARRIASLQRLVDGNELAESEPGVTSHYTHREHLAGRTINGDAVRGLCGAFFVPTRDHEKLPVCPTCEQRLAELPA